MNCMGPTRTEAAVAIVKPLSVLKLAGSPAVLLKNFTSIPPTHLAVADSDLYGRVAVIWQ